MGAVLEERDSSSACGGLRMTGEMGKRGMEEMESGRGMKKVERSQNSDLC